MAPYLELAPPPHLADSVECFWTMESATSFCHRVLPDGCADILFTRDSKPSLMVVGTMTQYADFKIPARQLLVGIRFRPGMWVEHFGVPSAELVNAHLPLEEVWGAGARTLLERMAHTSSAQQCAELLGQALRPSQTRTPVQRVLGWMEANSAGISLDDLAF